MTDHKQASESITSKDAAVIKLLIKMGFQQKRIAALFDVNQGRIAEVNRGVRHGSTPSLDQSILINKCLPYD